MIHKVTYNIQLHEQKEYHEKYKEYFIDKYKMRHSLAPKIIYRNTTNVSGVFPSDNYFDEYLINEKLLGMVYFRRNECNLCDVYLIDFEVNIPSKWYKMENMYSIEVCNTYRNYQNL